MSSPESTPIWRKTLSKSGSKMAYKRHNMGLYSRSSKCLYWTTLAIVLCTSTLVLGVSASQIRQSTLLFNTHEITQNGPKYDIRRYLRVQAPSEADTLGAHSTTSVQHTFFSNPFDTSCSQPGQIKVNPLPSSSNEIKGEICTRSCSTDADCGSFTDPYANALATSKCMEHDASAPAPVPSTPPVTHYCLPIANSVYAGDASNPLNMCPGGMSPLRKVGSTANALCLFTRPTRIIEDFSLSSNNQRGEGWRVLQTLPARLNSPYAHMASSNAMNTRACVSVTSGGSPNLCPDGTFCQSGACLPNPSHAMCLNNGGTVGFLSPRNSASQPICTLVDRSKTCGGEFEPFLNTILTTIITWVLFFLQAHLSQFSFRKLFCPCCFRSHRSAVQSDEGLTLLPIERLTKSFVAKDKRFQKALDFIDTPFLTIMIIRTFWAIIALWSAIFAKKDCIDSFATFFYVFLNQEMAKQTVASSIILHNLLFARPSVFDSPIGIPEMTLPNPTCASLLGFLIANVMSLAATANLVVYLFACLVFQWPYFYIWIGIVLIQMTLVYTFVNVIPKYMYNPTVERFCNEASKLNGSVPTTGQLMIPPSAYKLSIQNEERSLPEMVVFAQIYTFYFVLQKHIWYTGEISAVQNDIERVKDRASDQILNLKLLSRVGIALEEYSGQYEVPPIMPTLLLTELYNIIIGSLEKDTSLFQEEVKGLFQTRDAEIREFIAQNSLPSLNVDSLGETTSNDIQLEGVHPTSNSAFIKKIDEQIISELLESKDPDFVSRVQTYRHSIHEMVPNNSHSALAFQEERDLPVANILVELTERHEGVDVELRKIIITTWIRNGRLTREDYALFTAIVKNRQARNNITISLFESFTLLNQRATQARPRLLALFYQFITWVLIMGCNYYFFTSYKNGFDITRDRLSMKEYYSGSVALKWYNYFF